MIRVKVHFLCVRVGVWWVLIFIQFNSIHLQFFPPCSEAVLTRSLVTLNLASDQESVNIFDHDFTSVPLQSQFASMSCRNTAVGFGVSPSHLIVSTSGCS